MKELTLLHGQIDKIFSDLIDLDIRFSKMTDRSIGFSKIRDMKNELAANADRAVYASIERKAYYDVIHGNMKIKDAAKKYAVSPSTIRRWMDKVTEGKA